MKARPPIVGIPCDHRMIGQHPFHAAGQKYIVAVKEAAGALPLLVPVLAEPLSPSDILEAVDGILFTGSPSNVAPMHYGGPEARTDTLLDVNRDRLTLPLMRAAVERGAPILCLCRGFQEMNVAFGGTLYQHLHEIEGREDHREDYDAPLEVQYGPRHDVHVVAGGMLSRLGVPAAFKVNSLHSQGIDKLAPALRAEAKAPDGTIEAASKDGSFALGVQWHPEWKFWENAVSRAILSAFGEAVATRARK
ncbi:MAG: gamma-glutamyl-gamma-aminobutyrate hydrolase family protein [Alphaproteobacteria bacterium]